MRKLLLTGFLAIAVIAGAIAQKAGYDPVNAPFGHGEDSVNCRVNLSLMQTAAKAEAYESALIPWSSVYENCPAASKNTFIYGPRIFKALYEKETDAAKKSTNTFALSSNLAASSAVHQSVRLPSLSNFLP